MKRLPLLLTLLLAGCATPQQRQLGHVIGALDDELHRLEEQLAALGGLRYQKAIDAPLSLRQRLATREQEGIGARLADGPELTYYYRLPRSPEGGRVSAEPCHDYEFELRRLGHFGVLHLSWQSPAGEGHQIQYQRTCLWPAVDASPSTPS